MLCEFGGARDDCGTAVSGINESDRDCVFLCMSGGKNEGGGYSDVDMAFTTDGKFVHKDGTPYEDATRPA